MIISWSYGLHCVSVEVINEVVPANNTVVLNCTLPRDGDVTWFYNDWTIDLSSESESYEVEDGNLKFTAGEF